MGFIRNQLRPRGPLVLFLSTGILSSSLFAAAAPQPSVSRWNWLHGVEVTAGFGPTWFSSNQSKMIVSSNETDTTKTKSVTNGFSYKVGVGYHLLAPYFSQRTYLNDLLFELNFYYTSATVKGGSWQYQYSLANNYNFRAPFSSARLMLDFKPAIFSYYHFSPYPILGIGNAWNSLSYYESPTPGFPANGAANLNSRTISKVAYDVGAGLRYAITPHASVSLEYLYYRLGSQSPSGHGTANSLAIISPPSFFIYSQSLLLNASWTF